MADLPPNIPTGAVPPPPKKETGKVQPKKETVRINLPPKPSAAPTIKLPTLPPGGPTGATGVPVAPAPASAAAPVASAAAPRLATAAAPAAAHGAAQPKPASAPQPRTVVAAIPVAVGLKGWEKSCVYAAAVFGLAAVGIVVWVYLNLQNTVTNFSN